MRYLLCLIILSLLSLSPAGAQEDNFFDAEQTATITENAPYTTQFQSLVLYRSFTFVLYDLTDETLLAAIAPEHQMPVVSAIKGPIFIYFCAQVDEQVWNTVPTDYWETYTPDDVPEEFRETWQEHRSILNDLYRMIVYSDNHATGNVLLYAQQLGDMGDMNPIEAFNHWSEDVVGTSPESGMHEWDQGATDRPGFFDARYNQRLITIEGIERFYSNTVSAVDLARYYLWLYRSAPQNIRAKTDELLSIIHAEPSYFENTAYNLDGIPVSKDGFVGPGADHNQSDEYLTADAGLILLEDRDLIVVTMAVNSGDRLAAVYGEIENIIRSDRGQIYWPDGLDFAQWLRSESGPLGENNLSLEALYFIADYITESGTFLLPGEVFAGDEVIFHEAHAVWLEIFPGDLIPSTRNDLQYRVMQVRYGNASETLHDIAAEINDTEN
jgi:hypothetical protein